MVFSQISEQTYQFGQRRQGLNDFFQNFLLSRLVVYIMHIVLKEKTMLIMLVLYHKNTSLGASLRDCCPSQKLILLLYGLANESQIRLVKLFAFPSANPRLWTLYPNPIYLYKANEYEQQMSTVENRRPTYITIRKRHITQRATRRHEHNLSQVSRSLFSTGKRHITQTVTRRHDHN